MRPDTPAQSDYNRINMDSLDALGGSLVRFHVDHEARTQFVQIQHPLRRVLAFTGRSIDDLINDPIARNEVFGYYKLHRQVGRRAEILELERQWNPLG